MRSLLRTLPLLLLGACTSPTPVLDQHFGVAVDAAKHQQIIHAQPASAPAAGPDGVASRNAVRRYQKSFESPPPTANVLNIGGGILGSSDSTGGSR